MTIIHEQASDRGLDYLVIGGHAINVYCEPRATLDVGLMIKSSDREAWCELMRDEGFPLRYDGESFLRFSPPYGVDWRMDLMLVNDQTFTKAISMARSVTLLGIPGKVPNPEHLIAMKLHALKRGHQERFEKDMGDVLGLMRHVGLNPRYPEFKELIEKFGNEELHEYILKRFAQSEPGN